MKYLKQFAIILAVSFAGEILSTLIPLPIPAGIYGIILLFLALCLGLIHISQIRETAHFLVDIMTCTLIPAVVGLIDTWGLVSSSLAAYLCVILVTTVLVMAVSGLVTQAIMRKRGESHE